MMTMPPPPPGADEATLKGWDFIAKFSDAMKNDEPMDPAEAPKVLSELSTALLSVTPMLKGWPKIGIVAAATTIQQIASSLTEDE